MKTMFGKYLALIAALLLISGCPNPFEPPVPEKHPADEGYFSLYLGGINTGRTILPATVQNDFLLYTLEFFPSGTTTNPLNSIERNNSNISEPILLSAGTWDLYVIAYMDVAKTKPAAQGHLKDIEIGSGETVRNSITLAAIIDEGEGVFKWNISYPTNVTSASMTITSLDSTNDTPKTTLYFIGGTPLTGNADSLALNVGYYRVVFNLSIGVLKTERRETLHIYKNMESSFEYTFIRNHFTYIIVTSGADSGVGSLRQAIADAPANSTIIIDNSVKTILLQNRLTINKNLVISGNSVIVTRDPTWTTVDYTTQLLYISGSTTTVTISHVHFKDGSTTDNGVAIFNNSSSLTLESCIFNGNRTPPTNSNAGAIYNNGTLNVRGCTFYNNYTGGSNTGAGGAISTSTGTVTLEGNLFFGNSRPVVSNLYNSTIISRGYNMIDVPFGTGNNLSGWNAGTGDTTFSSLGINGVPLDVDTFIPVFGVRNYIPSVSEDFPLTDFYGDNRTFPGVPGAVASVNMNIVPVTELIGVPASAIVGTPLTLIGTVSPSNATNQRITWSVSNAGTTGATITGDNVLNTTNAGTVIVTAAIANGTAPDVAYTQNFTINILFISVTEITGVPALITAGTSMTLIGTVSPGNAINQTIMWTVKNQGTTGATIINGNTLVTTSMGTVVITATVSNGVSVGTNYIQDFTINSCSTDILVTSSADSGVGSLRHATEYIFAGGTITIDNSVKTIVLNSRLTIDRSLIIEGNGVTLTRTSSSWAPDYLLYIGDEAETITISRVHFKNGYAYEYGVAIRSYSASLTLESCIFSGNRTSSNTAYGSAIWNYFGSLFIRGCTFYNNRANLIVNDVTRLLIVTYGTVVLEGNLFFGNGDPSHDSLLGGVSYPSSKGYNVVDVPFGRDVYQSGWNAGTGDTTFSSLGINSIPFDVDTFVPIYELRNYLPSVSEDFPLTDFYGNYRTYPGAPGAVN
jgi:formylmethanofuran dehydrogenase subunit D